MAKRSSPIWQMIVLAPGSSGGFGNGKIFWLFFMTTLIPLTEGKGKASFFWISCGQQDRWLGLLTEGS